MEKPGKMELSVLKEEVRMLIQKNEVELALRMLRKNLYDLRFLNEIDIHLGRLQAVNNEFGRGLITQEVHSISETRISMSVLKLLDNIGHKFVNEPGAEFYSFILELQKYNPLYSKFTYSLSDLSEIREAGFKQGDLSENYLFEKLEYTAGIQTSPIDSISESSIAHKTALALAASVFDMYLTSPYFNRLHLHNDPEGQLGALPMSRYYLQLSYLSHQQLRDRDSLIRQEKESSAQKARNRSRFTTDLAHDYISESIIGNNRRILISGNPGIGKSTYARWLCWQFGIRQIILPALPLYIRLGDLPDKGDNILLEYLLQTFLSGKDHYRSGLKSLLGIAADGFLLILDGYDELSQEKQKRLVRDLRMLHHDLRYILLSRPYGLIDHPFNPDAAFQIDGFNDNTIYQYIDLFTSENPRPDKDRDELLNIIFDNPVLHEYAATPLMLSQMVLLYLQQAGAKQRLERISSIYQLQWEVFEWLKSYSAQKPNPLVLNSSRIASFRQFAAQLEINRLVTYQNKKTVNPHEPIVRELAALGIGNYKQISGLGESWQFYFYSLTFQEFLAAEYLADTITPEAFIYLIRERFFWNFSKMLMGRLSNLGEEDRINEILLHLDEASRKEDRAYYRYIYFMLLGETSLTYLNAIIRSTEIRELVDLYKTVYFDSYWAPLLLETITRLFPKLTPTLQASFREEIALRLPMATDDQPDWNTSSDEIFYLYTLIEELRLDRELGFAVQLSLSCKRMIHGLNQTSELEALLSSKEEDEESEEAEIIADQQIWYLNRLQHALDAFENTPAQIIREVFKGASLDIPSEYDHYLQKTVRILARKIPDNKIDQDFQTKFSKITQHASASIDQASFTELMPALWALCEKYQAAQENDKQTIATKLQAVAELLLKSLDYAYSTSDEDLASELAGGFPEVLAEGLTLVNQPALYPTIFTLVHRFFIWFRLDIPNHEAFRLYIEELIKESLEKLTPQSIQLIIAALGQTYNGKYLYTQIREPLFVLLRNLLELLESKPSSNDQEDSHEIAGHDGLIDITCKFAELPDFIFDKKYLVDQLLSPSLFEIPIVSQKILPELISHEFPFYEEKYWKVVFYLMEQSDHWEEVFRILDNEGIYYYSSNLPSMARVWKGVALWIDNCEDLGDQLESSHYGLINGIAHSLGLLSKAEDKEMEKLILPHTARILRRPEVKDYFNDDDPLGSLGVGEFTGWVYQYLFTRDTTVIPEMDINKHLRYDDSIRQDLAEKIIQFHLDRSLNVEEILSLESTLGKELVSYIWQYLHNFTLTEYSYQPSKLEQLLNLSFS